VSARDVPGSSGFKEAVDEVKFPALRSSPTVSLRFSGIAEIRAKIGHRHWPKSRGFGHAEANVGERRLSSPFDYDGQRGFWPGQKEKGIANH
jgi:hypothetical protein